MSRVGAPPARSERLRVRLHRVPGDLYVRQLRGARPRGDDDSRGISLGVGIVNGIPVGATCQVTRTDTGAPDPSVDPPLVTRSIPVESTVVVCEAVTT